MATALPIPLEFRLPEGWRAAPPDDVGAPGAAFVALHSASSRPGFSTNITVDGEQRPPGAGLAAFAEESVEQLRQECASLQLRDRSEFGSADAPGLSQTLELSTNRSGSWQNLTQCQVYLAMSDAAAAEDRAVIRLIMTAASEEFSALVPDFQQFLSSVRPDSDVHPQ